MLKLQAAIKYGEEDLQGAKVNIKHGLNVECVQCSAGTGYIAAFQVYYGPAAVAAVAAAAV